MARLLQLALCSGESDISSPTTVWVFCSTYIFLPALVCFVLQGSKIRGTAFNLVAEKLYPLFEKDKEYVITCGKVQEADKNYPTQHPCEIIFNEKTTVTASVPDEGTECLNGYETGEILLLCLQTASLSMC